MKKETITCDFCNKDLTSGKSCDFRIILGSQMIPVIGGSCNLGFFSDPFPETKHFCGLGCLKQWVNKQ